MTAKSEAFPGPARARPERGYRDLQERLAALDAAGLRETGLDPVAVTITGGSRIKQTADG